MRRPTRGSRRARGHRPLPTAAASSSRSAATARSRDLDRELPGIPERVGALRRRAPREHRPRTRIRAPAPGCRWERRSPHEHPHPDRRRPGARPRRLSDDPRGRARPARRRRGQATAPRPSRRRAAPGPDIVLMDIRMPTIDGLEATRRIMPRPRSPPRVLMLTTFDLDEYVFDALHAGASGFLLKDVPPEQLVAGIRTVAEGDSLLAPSVTRRLIESFVRDHPHAPQPPPSSTSSPPRELEILTLIARGLSNAEIAEQLVVSGNDRQDARRARAREARPARPRPGRRPRLRAPEHRAAPPGAALSVVARELVRPGAGGDARLALVDLEVRADDEVRRRRRHHPGRADAHLAVVAAPVRRCSRPRPGPTAGRPRRSCSVATEVSP